MRWKIKCSLRSQRTAFNFIVTEQIFKCGSTDSITWSGNWFLWFNRCKRLSESAPFNFNRYEIGFLCAFNPMADFHRWAQLINKLESENHVRTRYFTDSIELQLLGVMFMFIFWMVWHFGVVRKWDRENERNRLNVWYLKRTICELYVFSHAACYRA